MTSSTRIVVDEDEPEVDIAAPPFSPRPNVKPRKDKDFTDEFVVLDFLGRGKFGEVKRCRELATGREFAAKFIATPRPQDRTDVEREITTMRRLHHRRIVQLYDAFESKKEMCLILEIVYGGELFDRVITEDFLLTEKACICIVRQICEGVEFIHSHNIIHLDMKPENILCLSKSSNRIKIIDFGLARDYNPKSDTRVLFGTPEFMAPEVIQYDPIDFATDMWSIGVICYVLLSGLSPFLGDNDHDTLGNVIRGRYGFDFPEFKDVSSDAKDMISRLLVTDIKKRLSASQCLEHPWLKKMPKPTTPTLDLSKIQLKHFVYQRKWQKAVNALIALKRMGVSVRPPATAINSKARSHPKTAANDTEKNGPPAPPTSSGPSCDNTSVAGRQQPATNTFTSSSTKSSTRPSPSLAPLLPAVAPSRSRPVSMVSVSPSPSATPVAVPLAAAGRQPTQPNGSPSVNEPISITATKMASAGDVEELSTATLNRRTCHKAADAAEHFGNGHVFNLSKMIQLNRASHHHDEPSPVEIWQRDCRIAGGGTLGRRQKQQEQQRQQPPQQQQQQPPLQQQQSQQSPKESTLQPQRQTSAAVAGDVSYTPAASVESPTSTRGSSTNQRIRNGYLSNVEDTSSTDKTDTANVEDIWNVATTLTSNGVRSPPPPLQSKNSFSGGGNEPKRNQQTPSAVNRRQQPSPGGGSGVGSRLASDSFSKAPPPLTTTTSMTNGTTPPSPASQSSSLWSRQNSVDAPNKLTTSSTSTLNNMTTSTTSSRDAPLIKDRVRFFNKSEPTQPQLQSPTTPAKTTSWFKRNGLFK